MMMRFLFVACCFITTCLPLAHAQNSPAEQRLLDKAYYWQQKGDFGKAQKSLQKLIVINPTNADALTRLGMIEALQGNKAKATEALLRLRRAHPGHPGIAKLETSITYKLGASKTLAHARELANSGQTKKALLQYRNYFGKRKPFGVIGMEYYQIASGLPDQWQLSVNGMERLVKENPSNLHYQLSLAKLLINKSKTRKQGIRLLSRLSNKTSVSNEATAAWKQALIWLPVNKSSVPNYKQYLTKHKTDEQIKLLVKQVKDQSQYLSVVDKKNKAAFKALDRGQLSLAEKKFRELLKKSPGAEVNGGLGLVLLKRKRFSSASHYLYKAIKQDPEHASRWSSALRVARYWSLLSKAEKLQRAGKLKSADAKLIQAEKLMPSESEATVRRARLQLKRGNFSAKHINTILRKSPNNFDVHAQVVRLQSLHKSPQALAAARQLLHKFPGKQESSLIFTQTYTRAKKTARNKTILQHTITKLENDVINNPESVLARLHLARLYQVAGKTDVAMQMIDGALRLNPGMPEALYAKAIISAENEQWTTASRAIQAIPRKLRTAEMNRLADKVFLNNKIQHAITLHKAERYQEARAVLESISDAPDKNSIYPIANAWQSIGDHARAIRITKKYMKKRPESDYGIRLFFVSKLISAQENEEAAIWLRNLARSRNKMSDESAENLAKLEQGFAVRMSDQSRKRGHYAKAWNYLAPYLKKRPVPANAQLALARIYDDAGRARDALPIYNHLLQLQPDNMDVLEAAALSAIAAKRYKYASELIDKGIRLNPNDERFYLLRGDLAQQQGNEKQALSSFQQAKNILNKKDRHSWAPAPIYHGENIAIIANNPFGAPQIPPSQQVALQRSLRQKNPFIAPVTRRVQRQRAIDSQLAGPQYAYSPARDNILLRQSADAPTTTRVSSKPEGLEQKIFRLQSQRSRRIDAGPTLRERSGEAGLSQLTDTETPIQITFNPGENQIVVRVLPVMLSAGTLNMANADLSSRFGSNDVNAPGAQTAQISQRNSGVGLQLMFKSSYLDADIGVSPLGFRSPKPVGGIRLKKKFTHFNFDVSVSQRSVTESLLSYAGMLDPTTATEWGAVVRSGGKLNIGYDEDDFGLYGRVGYHLLTGKNVVRNTAGFFELGGYSILVDDADMELTLGGHIHAMGYKKNLQYYTLGHGGYFSPQQDVSLSVPLNIRGRKGILAYKVNGYLGLNWISEDAVAYFPGNATLQGASGRFFPGKSSTGLLFGLSGAADYQLSQHLDIGGHLGTDNANNFTLFEVGMHVTYWFDSQPLKTGFDTYPLRGYYAQDIY